MDELQPGHTQNGSDATFLYFAFSSNLLRSRILINSPSAVLVGVARLPGYKLGFSGWSDNWKGAVANIFPETSSKPEIGVDAAVNKLIGDPDEGGVWGAVWEISRESLNDLDRQEGVHLSEYEALDVVVHLLRAKKHHSDASPTLQQFARDQDLPTLSDGVALQQLCRHVGRQLDTSTWDPSKENFEPVRVRAYQKVAQSPGLPNNVKLGLPSDTYKLVVLKGAIECNLPPQYLKLLNAVATNNTASPYTAWKY